MKTYRNIGTREISTSIGPHRYVIAPGAYAAIPDKYAYVPAAHGLALVEETPPAGVEIVRGSESDPRLEALLSRLPQRVAAGLRVKWDAAPEGDRPRMLKELRAHVEALRARETSEAGGGVDDTAGELEEADLRTNAAADEAPAGAEDEGEPEDDGDEEGLAEQLAAAAAAVGRGKAKRRAPTN
jgi:hypothetical protein